MCKYHDTWIVLYINTPTVPSLSSMSAGLQTEFWALGRHHRLRLARWSGHHRGEWWRGGVGGHLEDRQWKPVHFRQVRLLWHSGFVQQKQISGTYYKSLMCFRQEQVHEGVYSPIQVTVETDEGPILCRTYKMNNFRPCLPSPQYKKV